MSKNISGECLLCKCVIKNYHNYDNCDHKFFDGKIGCDYCLNTVNINGVPVLLCWGCHCRLPRSNKSPEDSFEE